MNSIPVLSPVTLPWYQLLDSGNGEKLEQVGNYRLRRPDSQALWTPNLSTDEWQKADAMFNRDGTSAEWITKKVSEKWELQHDGLKFLAKLTPFGHIGVFPEQAVQWKFMSDALKQTHKPTKVLSLFSYTGIASLVAAQHDAHVTHVDASKPAISWAVENQKLSGLEDKPIRWIIDDALKFVKREIRREVRYDGIVLDPPKYGRGPGGEVWQFEDSFTQLLDACRQVLTPDPLFVIVTAYAIPISAVSLGNVLEQTMREFSGKTEYGELALQEENSNRLLPTSLFTRWSKS